VNQVDLTPLIGGSISHNNDTALSIVYLQQSKIYFGIDIEHIMTLETSKEIGFQIHDLKESGLLCISEASSNLATSIIYSAKESIFKCLYPSIESFFGFEDAKLIEVKENQLIFEMNKENPLFNHISSYIKCKFTVDKNSVTTLCSMNSNF